MLDEFTKVRAGDDITIEVLDTDFGDEFEAERMPLAYIEYDEYADEASVDVRGRDGRYPVVVRQSIELPALILTDSKPRRLPLAVRIVGVDGLETLITGYSRVENGQRLPAAWPGGRVLRFWVASSFRSQRPRLFHWCGL